MAKGMTKAELVRTMAQKLELTTKQSAAFFDLLADTALRETRKNGQFTIPGIGKLIKAERRAPSLQFVPQTVPTAKSVRQLVKERAAVLDAGGSVISLAELDDQVEARKRRDAFRLRGVKARRHEATVKAAR